MLVRERDDDALVIAQATPRAWLPDGQTIDIENAPTCYGRITATIASRSLLVRFPPTCGCHRRRDRSPCW